ncbi:unnamed protein product [Zymoseptoria tritici ST99CH_1A5]|uniref:Uncharacterized protein n=1 Tax=Zymoseptoria tritici ST99CH_1A5 TaxID=1276529 RepID=A0A1Y6LZZ5_ZYMTR|nr:unnamed protein product [Zymoseptoria tritici ST99CH_1A5]
MQLCKNRPEGFGPHSRLHSSLPTTCFLDVIVIPLATWLYLLACIPILTLLFLGRKRYPTTTYDTKPTSPPRRRIWRTVLTVLYYFFALALIAMLSLEIARLVDAQLGIGLLPFTYAGILIAAGLHFFASRQAKAGRTGHRLAVRTTNAVYWLLLAIVFAIKVATYVKEGVHSRDATKPESNYKVVDEVTDVGVMIFLAAVLVLLEFVAG